MKRLLTFFPVVILAFLLFGCATSDNSLPPSPLVAFKPTIKTKLLWSAAAGSGGGKEYVRLTPAVAHDKVFTSDSDGNVTAVDAKSGAILWQVEAAHALTSGVGANDDQLFVATDRGEIVSLKQSNGSVLWQTPVSSEILSTPTVSQGVVLVKSIDGSLTALSARSGQQIWRFTQAVPSLILHASSQPAVSSGLAVAGFANGKLVAIALQSGKPQWMHPVTSPRGSTAVEQMVDIDVNPVVSDGVVYVATYQGDIAALNLNTGDLMWQHRISSYAGIAADSEYIYVTDAKGYVWSFKKDNGAVTWRQKKLLGRDLTGPAVVGRYLVVGDAEGYLHWISKGTGAFAARDQLDASGVVASPVVSNNVVYVYTVNGTLYAFRIA